MEYKRYNDKIVLRLDKNDELTACLKAVAEKENIGFASVEGIGATDNFTVGVFDPAKKSYDKFNYSGDHEINAVVGNITVVDDKPYVHVHITCTGAGGKVVGGHIFECFISLTCELFISIIGEKVTREHDSALGINVLSFKK